MPNETTETFRFIEAKGITFFARDRISLIYPAASDELHILSTLPLTEGQIIPLRIMQFDVRPPVAASNQLFVECVIEDLEQAQFLFIEQDAFLRMVVDGTLTLDTYPVFKRATYVNRFTGVKDEVLFVTPVRDTNHRQFYYTVKEIRGQSVSFELFDEREMLRRYNPVEYSTEGVGT